jgi:Asp-tRNA(Asn)/Glu-tRNA(Gln) amidotransferase A subunit family amidase
MTGNFLTATEIARRIRAGDLSPVTVVEACLARIAETEPALRTRPSSPNPA